MCIYIYIVILNIFKYLYLHVYLILYLSHIFIYWRLYGIIIHTPLISWIKQGPRLAAPGCFSHFRGGGQLLRGWDGTHGRAKLDLFRISKGQEKDT